MTYFFKFLSTRTSFLAQSTDTTDYKLQFGIDYSEADLEWDEVSMFLKLFFLFNGAPARDARVFCWYLAIVFTAS